MLQAWDSAWNVRRIDAAAVMDGAGYALRHDSGTSAVIERGADGVLTLAALGATDEVARTTRWAGVPAIDRRACLLTPGLVNAHTHLDLTHMGSRPHDPAAGFLPWIDMIRRERLTDEADITASIRRGVDLSLAGGTVLVGDIAGAVGGRPSSVPGSALFADGRINAVSFVEFFAQGARAPELTIAAYEVWNRLRSAPEGPGGRTVFGVQPHAPYSVGWGAYEDILESIDAETPACTHLAESMAEREFIARGTGPFRTLLERVGVWDDAVACEVGRGRTPIEQLSPCLESEHLAAVHCNDVTATDLSLLARSRAPVIYCPRASAYFAAEKDFGPHRYRDMLGVGVTVALGTDSIVNVDTPDRMSVWDEMRLLHQRDAADPVQLLAMATTAGATALRRDPTSFRFHLLGSLAGLLAVPVSQANRGAHPSEMLKAALAADRSERGDTLPPPELLAIGRV